MGRLLGELNYTQIEEIIHEGLHEFLDKLQDRLNWIDDAIYGIAFSRCVPNRKKHPSNPGTIRAP